MKYKAAGYCRVSKEDLGKKSRLDNSVSIDMQKSIINSYLKDRSKFQKYETTKEDDDIELIEFYIDDGITGTVTDRPAYQRMLKNIKEKKIDTIIVKDFSRLSRNDADMADFLKYEIKKLKIRLISLGDNFDSKYTSEMDIGVKLKAVVNSTYADDISNKVMLNLNAKRYDGKFIGSFAPYGYKKDEKDKNHLVIDDEAAEVVKQIFKMFISGTPKQRIAKILNSKGIPCPTEYKNKNKLNYKPAKNHLSNFHWGYSTINKILANEVYIGNLIQRRTAMEHMKRQDGISYKRKVPLKEEQQIKVENTHEPIIDKETFEQAKQITRAIARTPKNMQNITMFAGILKCADCGRALTKSVNTIGKGEKVYYYRCSTYKNFDFSNPHNKHDIGCTPHTIREDILKEIVAEEIQNRAKIAFTLKDKQELRKYLKENSSTWEEKDSNKIEYEKAKNELNRLEMLLNKNLDTYNEGLIDKEEFIKARDRYKENQKQLQERIDNLEKKLLDTSYNQNQHEIWVEKFINFGGITPEDLDREIITSLIDKIIVYENKTIHIKFHDNSPYLKE